MPPTPTTGEVYCFLRDECGARFVQGIPIIERDSEASEDGNVRPLRRARFKLGNIKEHHMLELVASQRQRQFGLDQRDPVPRFCIECDVRFACHGGCPKDRFITTPQGEPGLNYLCAGFKEFFHHVDRPMRFMAEQLRRGGAPSEIVRLYAAEDTMRGRNDPCTCGSGRMWKHCHRSHLCRRAAHRPADAGGGHRFLTARSVQSPFAASLRKSTPIRSPTTTST